MKVELDLYNCFIKNATGIDISPFTKKIDLACLKSNVNNLDIDKLKNIPTNLTNLKSIVDKRDVDKLIPVPTDFSKLSDAVKNAIVKKDPYKAKNKNIEDKIPHIINLATKTTSYSKTNEIKVKNT